MRILVQHKRTGRYYQGPGIWVNDPREAFDFPSSAHAMLCCAQQRYSEVNLVFEFERQHALIQRPLAEEDLQAVSMAQAAAPPPRAYL